MLRIMGVGSRSKDGPIDCAVLLVVRVVGQREVGFWTREWRAKHG